MNIKNEIINAIGIINKLPAVYNHYHIGSSVYIIEYAKDVDFIIYFKHYSLREYTDLLISTFDFDSCSNYNIPSGCIYEWNGLRKGNINFIITTSEHIYNSFVTATEVCKFLHLSSKEERIAIHEIIRDNKKADDITSLKAD